MQIELIDAEGQLVVSAGAGEMVLVPDSTEGFTACMDNGDELLLMRVPPGAMRWAAFGCAETILSPD